MPETVDSAEMQMLTKIRAAVGLPPLPKARDVKDMSALEDREDQDEQLNLDPEKESDILRRLNVLIPNAIEAQAGKRTEWDNADRNYKGDLPERTVPWEGASNINVPITKTKLRKLTRKLKGAVFRHRPIWPLEAQKESEVDRVEKTEQFLDYKGKRDMKVEIPANHVLNDDGRYGTGIMKVPWVLEQEDVTEVETWDGTQDDQLEKFHALYPDAKTDAPDVYARLFFDREPGVTATVSYKKTTYRGPRPERIHPKNMVVPKGYTDINKMPFFFEHMKKSWDELQAGVANGMYKQSALDKIRKKYTDNKKDDLSYITKEYDVYEGMWKYAATGDIKEKCLFTVILDEDAYLRGIKYPYKHGRSYYIPFYFIPDADSFWGEAIAEDLADTQKAVNMILNIAIDSDMANYPVFKRVNSDESFDEDVERWYPFKEYLVENINDLEQMDAHASAANSLKLMDVVQRYADDVSGVSELFSGRESSLDPNAPAAKAQMLMEVSQEDMNEYLKWWLMGWNEVAYQICELYNQYGSEGEEYRVLNSAGEPSLEAAPIDLRVRPALEAHAAERPFSRTGQHIALVDTMEKLREDELAMMMIKQDPRGYFKLWEDIMETSAAGLGKKVHQVIPTKEMVEEFQISVQQEAIRRFEQEKIAEMEQARAQGGGGAQLPAMVGPEGGGAF